jgi:hypothetical protein
MAPAGVILVRAVALALALSPRAAFRFGFIPSVFDMRAHVIGAARMPCRCPDAFS